MHVARTTPLLALLFLLLGTVQLASATIYPTLPVQGTVWTAGQSVLVTWAEDGLSPAVNAMGPVNIELWANGNTFVTTLAVNVDPKAGSVQVTVPTLPSGGDQFIYILRFVSHVPMESMVYSADFKIVSGTNPSPPPITVLHSSTAPLPSTSTTITSTTTTSISITPLTSSTPVVVTTEMTPVADTPVLILITSTSMATPTVITLENLPVPTVTTGSNATATNTTASSGTPHPQQLGGGKNAAGRNLDMEKLMFRILFIIWPALVGIVLTV